MEDHVKKLIEKAAQHQDPHHAMQFAQAALNAAHALQVLKLTESMDTDRRPGNATS
jgi:hypothetical protein